MAGTITQNPNEQHGGCALSPCQGARAELPPRGPLHTPRRPRPLLTLSSRWPLQPGWASSSLTISTCPCSLAHMRAVEPSSSWMLTSAPQASRPLTMSIRPWLTASMRAVCPACGEKRISSTAETGREGGLHWGGGQAGGRRDDRGNKADVELTWGWAVAGEAASCSEPGANVSV